MGGPKEECGVAAVDIKEGSADEKKAVFYLYKMLLSMQGRGQLSAGITTYLPKSNNLLDTHKDLGVVNELFKTRYPMLSQKLFEKHESSRGIGHVRYATCGKDGKSYAQPFERKHGRKGKWFSICFNGNLANYSELKNELVKKHDYHIIYDTDTEIIMHYIARYLRSSSNVNLAKIFGKLSQNFDGSYNIAFINARGDLIVARDPLGFKPMVYGKKDGVTLVASESNALTNCGIMDFKTLNPGEMLHVHNGDIKIERFAKSEKKAFCMFEWVYFANAASSMEEKSVYLARRMLGKELAKLETEKIDDDCVVVPVPDSAKPAGDSYAYHLGVPSSEGLIRNRFVGRTFIETSGRKDKIRNKFSVLKEVVKGKRVFLVDDSIVRGNTTKNIVKYIKEVGGAKEVHVRVSCPPIMCPCFYGIDMSTVAELFAPNFCSKPGIDQLPEEVSKKMAKAIGADSVIYQSISGLIRAIGLPKSDLCMACLNGNYPTCWGKKLYKKSLKEKSSCKRAYE